MGKVNFSKLFNDAKTIASKHSPEILTGLGIAGMITTTVLAVKATPKAMQLMEEKKREEQKEKLTAVETVKVAWKPYGPAIITGVVSTGCLIGATHVNLRRNAALATAYQLSTQALTEYKDKVVETIGEEKEKEIRNKVTQEKLDKTPVPERTANLVMSSNDEVLFYDEKFGQYFYSTPNKVDAAINEVNYQMLTNNYASLNDFYDELGIDHIEIGESLGWNIYREGKLEVSRDNTMVAKNGKPCIILEYYVAPDYDYWKINRD